MAGDRKLGEYLTHDEELALIEEEERLPWLESGEDDLEMREVDSGRVIGFALIGLIAVAALVAAGWWLIGRTAGGELLAEGSTIEAPDGPYKERPEDPGGKEFAGTGDLAPAVAEGQTREGRLAAPPPQSPASQLTTSDDGEPEPEPEPAPEPAAQGVPVQIGGYFDRQSAETGWNTLRGQTDNLNGVNYRIVQGRVDIGTVYRLQAMAGDLASARALCQSLQEDGLACQVKRWAAGLIHIARCGEACGRRAFLRILGHDAGDFRNGGRKPVG